MDVSKIPRIQTKQNGQQFLLHINEAQQKDTGLYYCLKVSGPELIFMNGTFVKIEGQESVVNVVLQKNPSTTIHPENPGTLQCSVLSKSEWSTCPADNRVYWFRAGSDDSHPNFLYLQEISQAECERSPGVPSAQTCLHNFSDISNAGTYYCAVAACGQILFGNGAKLKGVQSAIIEDFSKLVLSLLISALVISFAVISCLVYKIKKKTCGCCKAHVVGIDDNQSQQKEEDTLIYSSPQFTMNKTEKARRGNLNPAQEEMVVTNVIYTDVKRN
ncbi:PREDICTED: uncharacterized protein LOC107104065 [Cyprinodon variegatus]|uniref:uncharacterized protein LOC107104065 n=1 Tax=Cyprinodon variegatus TaxID=28743 RepID=UPI000742C2FC|nr:PREDICTED: uncharacterized protein LOC107104065 [Cyprinodon variegatus]